MGDRALEEKEAVMVDHTLSTVYMNKSRDVLSTRVVDELYRVRTGARKNCKGDSHH